MRLIRPTHDPKKTPFIERLDDVRRIFLALPEPLNVAYAIGALAGLRTGEVRASLDAPRPGRTPHPRARVHQWPAQGQRLPHRAGPRRSAADSHRVEAE